MASAPRPWQPAEIRSPIEAKPTGSSVLRVETDQGEGFLKAMGAKCGPHVLACELVGTLLAQRLRLRTLDFVLFDVPGDRNLRFADGRLVEPGPGFLTRAEKHQVWSGDMADLDSLQNPEDINRLIVFDTWTMNCDRYRPPNGATLRKNEDNVFISKEASERGRHVLKAMDHGCCFTCERDVTASELQRTMNDDRLFGLFPGFLSHTERDLLLGAATDAAAIERGEVENMIHRIPSQWQIDDAARRIWCDWICQRAKLVRRIIERKWPVPPMADLFSAEGETR